VFVRSPDVGGLASVLSAEGATVLSGEDGSCTVTGLSAVRIGELAYEHRFMLHELTTRTSSLEEAFMELTADSVEFLAGEAR
jgi:ABC-2 type transport system ATP-binding protein